jgi:hypothetical protein
MKVKTTVHIHYFKFDWDAEGRFEVLSFKADDDNYRTYIGQQEIEIEVPDDYDPRAQQIAALEKQKQKVMADYQKTVTEINNRINKLQALEYSNE